jgi:hypothetical protein
MFSGRKRNMSSPITPIKGPPGPATPTSSVRTAANDETTFVSELIASNLRIEAARGGPPAEVLDQMQAAGRIHEQLLESGHEVRFSTREGGEVAAELQDRSGNTVRTMSIAEVLDVAAGKPVR